MGGILLVLVWSGSELEEGMRKGGKSGGSKDFEKEGMAGVEDHEIVLMHFTLELQPNASVSQLTVSGHLAACERRTAQTLHT